LRRCDTIPQCDGRTDNRTDRRTDGGHLDDGYNAQSILLSRVETNYTEWAIKTVLLHVS